MNSRRLCALILVGALVAVALMPHLAAQQQNRPGRPTLPASASLSQISWLAGNWRGTEAGQIVEERWTSAAGGAMLGIGRTVRANRMVSFEFLRIVERDGKLVYIAQPNGQPPTEFTLTGMNENSVIFENPQHDFPKVITYTWRDDGSLQAVVSDGGQKQETFEFTRAGQ